MEMVLGRRKVRSTGLCFEYSVLLSRGSSSTIITTVVATEDTLYAIGLTKSFASLTLSVTSLDAHTGSLISTQHVSSKITSPSNILSLKSSDESLPVLTWLDDGIHALTLTSRLTSTPKYVSKNAYTEISDLTIGKTGIFIGRKADGTTDVLRISPSVALEIIGEFTGSVSWPCIFSTIFTDIT